MGTPRAFASAPASTRSSSTSSAESSPRKPVSLPAGTPPTWRIDNGPARQSLLQPAVNQNIDPMPNIRPGFYTVETVMLPASDQQQKTRQNCFAVIAPPKGPKYTIPLVRDNRPLNWVACQNSDGRVTTSIFDALAKGGFAFTAHPQGRNFDCTTSRVDLMFSKMVDGGTGAYSFKAWLQRPPVAGLQAPSGTQTMSARTAPQVGSRQTSSSLRPLPNPAPGPAQVPSPQLRAPMPLAQAFKRQSAERAWFLAIDSRGVKTRVKLADIQFVTVTSNGFATASVGDAVKKGGFPQGAEPRLEYLCDSKALALLLRFRKSINAETGKVEYRAWLEPRSAAASQASSSRPSGAATTNPASSGRNTGPRTLGGTANPNVPFTSTRPPIGSASLQKQTAPPNSNVSASGSRPGPQIAVMQTRQPDPSSAAMNFRMQTSIVGPPGKQVAVRLPPAMPVVRLPPAPATAQSSSTSSAMAGASPAKPASSGKQPMVPLQRNPLPNPQALAPSSRPLQIAASSQPSSSTVSRQWTSLDDFLDFQKRSREGKPHGQPLTWNWRSFRQMTELAPPLGSKPREVTIPWLNFIPKTLSDSSKPAFASLGFTINDNHSERSGTFMGTIGLSPWDPYGTSAISEYKKALATPESKAAPFETNARVIASQLRVILWRSNDGTPGGKAQMGIKFVPLPSNQPNAAGPSTGRAR